MVISTLEKFQKCKQVILTRKDIRYIIQAIQFQFTIDIQLYEKDEDATCYRAMSIYQNLLLEKKLIYLLKVADKKKKNIEFDINIFDATVICETCDFVTDFFRYGRDRDFFGQRCFGKAWAKEDIVERFEELSYKIEDRFPSLLKDNYYDVSPSDKFEIMLNTHFYFPRD